MDTKKCKQCGRVLPSTEYWKPRDRSAKVHKCNDCVGDNMDKWARTNLNKFNADRVSSVDD